ncbi:MAG: hypothetical protein KGJ89_01795 [Patescibacteria group bacterium]|nr:hypothetical protein [Patescibacteria group bacterium]MDE2015610.1 hypothetical protein [Patescibacteria group bacterium]MDE2226667.1 hypothetical protein [Patescibacteria group bacterium]
MAKHSIIWPVIAAVFILAAAIFSLPQGAIAAFGVSPPFVNSDHLVAGAQYIQTVYLVQDQPDQDLRIKATLNVPDKIKPWIKIDKGLDFIIPKGVRQFPIQIEVDVPKSEIRGQYSGNLVIVSEPAQSGQVTIALGANIAINLTIGTDIFEQYSVQAIKPLDVEEGWNPRVDVKFKNDGNIPESFDGATFELIDKFGGTRLAYTQKTTGFPETPPFSIKEYVVEFPMEFHLGLGQYWADVNFYKGGKIIGHEKTVFNVLPAGSISGPTAQVLNFLKNAWVYYSAIGIVLALMIFFFFFKRKRHHR